MRTLIVEDELSSRKLLESYLSQLGEVAEVANGLEALEAVQNSLNNECPFDLICLDIMMPGMDGQAALKGIREIEQNHGIKYRDGAKVIMVTCHHDSQNIMQAFRRQCEGYLVKPLDLNKLEGLLNELDLT